MGSVILLGASRIDEILKLISKVNLVTTLSVFPRGNWYSKAILSLLGEIQIVSKIQSLI